MNRSLGIPAVCSLLGFTLLLATLYGVEGESQHATPVKKENVTAANQVDGSAAVAASTDPDSASAAEQVLTALAADYVRPWQSWASADHFRYSRAAPRPSPSIQSQVELAASKVSPPGGSQLATIVVTIGDQPQSFPCVLHPGTQEIALFVDGQWITAGEWLSQAPLPSGLTTDAREHQANRARLLNHRFELQR